MQKLNVYGQKTIVPFYPKRYIEGQLPKLMLHLCLIVAKGIKLNNIINYFIGLLKLYFYIVFRPNPACAEIGRAAQLS